MHWRLSAVSLLSLLVVVCGQTVEPVGVLKQPATATAKAASGPSTRPTSLPKPELAPDVGNPAKQQDIMKLLVLTGADKLAEQVVDQVVASLQQSMPQAPPSFWPEVRKECKTDDLMKAWVAVYDRYLSHDDIRELIKYHSSPIGQKMTRIQPVIVAESFDAGKAFGQQTGRRAFQKLVQLDMQTEKKQP